MPARIVLKPRMEKYLHRGYPWIFANQVATVEGSPARGDVVRIADASGRLWGQGLYHDTSLIAVRFLTPDPDEPIDADFFARRIDRALELRRQALGPTTHARLIFSESDGLPGTLVDQYQDVLTWTCVCYGMEQRRDLILDILEDRLRPSAIVERNDTWLREKDGLEPRKGILRGTLEGPVPIVEEDLTFWVDVLEGPKTGFFLDQRLHRKALRPLVRGRRVLDVFTADGGFGLHAAAAGAREVTLLDISRTALERARHNALENGLIDRVHFLQADAMEALEDLLRQGASFDVVVLDPPSFARGKRQVAQATRAYQRINILALQLLPEGGMLATASCSQAIDEPAFEKILQYALRKTGSRARVLFRGYQPPDHPVLPTMPETRYLKFFILQKISALLPGYAS